MPKQGEDRMAAGFVDRRRLVLGAPAWCLATLALPARAAGPSAAEILANADRVRYPGRPFRMTNTLSQYVAGKRRDQVVLDVYAKIDPKSGQFNSLVNFVSPARDTGKRVLYNGSNLWFYDPASKASVRISPQQRLIGQVSDGDVITVNLSVDYEPSITGEETVEGPDRDPHECWSLNLAAKTSSAIYNHLELWVEKGTFRPIKGKYYADSGRLLKIAFFRKYSEALGGSRAMESVIIDAVDSRQATTIKTTALAFKDLPDSWFQRSSLPQLVLK
jgi:hypothetical protein